jgi:hypothetical protein
MIQLHRHLSLFVLIGSLLVAMPAFAANVDGKAGIGFEETLTAVGIRQTFFNNGDTPDVRPGGLSGRYWLGNVALEAIFGASLSFANNLHHSGFLAIGTHYAAFRAPDVNLTIGVRGLFAWASVNQEDHDLGSRYGFAIEVPLRVEYFFTSAFAIAAAVGPVLNFPSPQRNGASVRNPLTTNVSSWDLSLFRGDFSGGLGFTYYFL